ncbi:SDR family NAD(P)-dependent oxidoreductase, partial [Planococcus sp. SIMBA_160]
GATVAINYSSSDDKAQAVVDEIAKAGGKAAKFKADLRTGPECDRLAKEVVDAFGGLDILVNNAGVFRTKPIAETSEQDWDDQ